MVEKGWDAEHDDGHDDCELLEAAICFAGAAFPGYKSRLFREAFPWPWDEASDNRERNSRLRNLEVAGALIAAEIDRLLRQGATDEQL